MKNKLLLSYFFYTISALGVTLAIKSHVGVSSFNAMNLSISALKSIPIGTVTIFFNLSFLAIYMYLTQFKQAKKYFLQGISVLLFGVLINFFNYTLLGDFTLENYALRVLLIAVSTMVSGLSIGMIIHYNQITFPLESLCVELADRTPLSFVQLRYGVDLISIAVSLLISKLYHFPLFVREGTLISMLVLSAAMNFSKSRAENTPKFPVKNISPRVSK